MNILGVGTDIIEVLRIAQMIERHGEQFVSRVYTSHEIDYCSSRNHATQHFAAHWVAKEAILKALGSEWVRGIRWKDIEIRIAAGERPKVAFAGGARELCETLGVTDLQLSLSHCRTYATAFAIAVKDYIPFSGPTNPEDDDSDDDWDADLDLDEEDDEREPF